MTSSNDQQGLVFGLFNKHINKFTIIVSSKNDISKDKKI